jgi:predicted nucleic acid-binding Zn ribbon protein
MVERRAIVRPVYTAKCEKCSKTVHYFLIEMTHKKTKQVLNVCAECAEALMKEKD